MYVCTSWVTVYIYFFLLGTIKKSKASPLNHGVLIWLHRRPQCVPTFLIVHAVVRGSGNHYFHHILRRVCDFLNTNFLVLFFSLFKRFQMSFNLPLFSKQAYHLSKETLMSPGVFNPNILCFFTPSIIIFDPVYYCGF